MGYMCLRSLAKGRESLGDLLYLIDRNLGYCLSLMKTGAHKVYVVSTYRLEGAGLSLQYYR
jgi:hypothetical protein